MIVMVEDRKSCHLLANLFFRGITQFRLILADVESPAVLEHFAIFDVRIVKRCVDMRVQSRDEARPEIVVSVNTAEEHVSGLAIMMR